MMFTTVTNKLETTQNMFLELEFLLDCFDMKSGAKETGPFFTCAEIV